MSRKSLLSVLLLCVMVGCGSPADSDVPSETSVDGPAALQTPMRLAPSTTAEARPAIELPPGASLLPPTATSGSLVCKYGVTIASQCTATVPQHGSSQINTRSEFVYSWQFGGEQAGGEQLREEPSAQRQAVLRLHDMKLSTTLDGQQISCTELCRSRFLNEQDGRRQEGSFIEATPDQQQVLLASFEAPLCTLSLDEYGQELDGETTSVPGAEVALGAGIIPAARLFHAPFFEGRPSWTAPAELSMGAGRYARGELTYTVSSDREPNAPNTVKVGVAGTLVGEEGQADGEIQNAVYRVTGEQHFDTDLGHWKAGHLDVALSFDTQIQDQTITTKGVIDVDLELLLATPVR